MFVAKMSTPTTTNDFDRTVDLMIHDALHVYLEGYVEYLTGTVTDDVSGTEVAVDDTFLSGGSLEYLLAQGATMTLVFEIRVTDLAPVDWIIAIWCGSQHISLTPLCLSLKIK